MYSCSDWTCRGAPLTSSSNPLASLCLLWEESFLPPSPICPKQFIVFYWVRRGSYMKNVLQRGTWRCEIADSSLPSAPCLKRYFFFYWQSGWISAWWRRLLLAHCSPPPHPPPTLIAFVSRSPPIYRCNFSNFSGLVVWRQKASPPAALWEMYIKLSRENTKETHWNLLTFMLSGRRSSCQRPPPTNPHQCNFIKWIIK